MKNGRAQFRNLPAEFPGTEVVALPKPHDEAEYSCVSVYCAAEARGNANGLVRVNLFASLMGIRSLVASAIVTTPFTGPVIHAAGFLADSFDVYLQAQTPLLEGYIALRADTCCATPGVLVPAPLQNPVVPDSLAAIAVVSVNPAPNQIDTGLYELHTKATDPGGIVFIPPGVRVLAYAMRALDGLIGTVTVAAPEFVGGGLVTVTVSPGESVSLNPHGVLVGPATITFTNFFDFIVETVR